MIRCLFPFAEGNYSYYTSRHLSKNTEIAAGELIFIDSF